MTLDDLALAILGVCYSVIMGCCAAFTIWTLRWMEREIKALTRKWRAMRGLR